MVGQVRESAGLPRDTRTRIEQGGLAEHLDRAANEEDAELMVVGARGMGALGAAVVGSVSSPLAGMASRPVVVVKKDAAVTFDR